MLSSRIAVLYATFVPSMSDVCVLLETAVRPARAGVLLTLAAFTIM